jgi:3-phenylpropionate/trans-cinnamate dioxygenase ferredoxin component
MPELREEPHGDGVDTPGAPVTHGDPIQADGNRLVALADLGEHGVVEVRTERHGVLAVGMADGLPFAVSNVCRHQFAKLGLGRVTEDGCLECPWHRARYDVRSGRMVSGPKGRIFGFKPYSATVRTVANAALPLRTHPAVVRDGAIWLD